MKEFVEFLIKQFITKPEALTVEETREDTLVRVTVCADPEDMGLIIGKKGKTIRSIRALTKAKAIRDGVKVFVDVC